VLMMPAERHALVNPTSDRCLLRADTLAGQALCDAGPSKHLPTPVNVVMHRRLSPHRQSKGYTDSCA
jgi:hypothetical protein